jgi:5-methylcytosine-specific restriction endonuclease McrA
MAWDPDFWAKYNAYLESAEWQEFRQYVFEVYGRQCFECLRWDDELGDGEWLEIDHLHYRTVFHETIDDVQVLCNTCHGAKTIASRAGRIRRKPGLLRRIFSRV